MIRITREDLRQRATDVNYYLKKSQLHVGHRYSKAAIDVYHPSSNHILKTIRSGLSNRECYDILNALEVVLWIEDQSQ